MTKRRRKRAQKTEVVPVVHINTARARGNLRLLPRPLAYCRPENDNTGRAS